MNSITDKYMIGFNTLQSAFDGQIEVLADSAPVINRAEIEITDGRKDFVSMPVPTEQLATYVGQILLMQDRTGNFYSPVVVSPAKHGTGYQITKLEQPYDPEVGISDGIRFGLAIKLATSKTSFGMHVPSGGLEAGHFSPLLVAGRNDQLAADLVARGDKATHGVLEAPVGGVAEVMAMSGLLQIPYKTAQIPDGVVVPLYWHKSLADSSIDNSAQYPDAVKLMLGAATNSLGVAGIDTARRLVEHAAKGARV